MSDSENVSKQGPDGASKITIKDIAREAGVGIATVSRVLNGNQNVKPATRELVQEVIRRYNFRPNVSARHLVRRSSQDTVIGIVIPHVENQYIFEVLVGIYRSLKGLDYNILIYNVEKGRGTVFEQIGHQSLAGLILFGDLPMKPAEKKIVLASKLPYIYIDYHDPNENWVGYNNITGGRLAAEYLYNRGCRRVTFFGLTRRSQQQQDRLTGFRDALTSLGVLDVQEIYTRDDDASYGMTVSLLNNGLTDGIFYFSDQLAYGGMEAKHTLRSNVTIIGYDDIFSTKFIGLSTIRQSAARFGEEGVRALLEMIENVSHPSSGPSVQIVLEPELVDRGS